MPLDGRLCGLIAADFLEPTAKKNEPLHFQNSSGFDDVRYALFRSGLLIAAEGTEPHQGRWVLVVDAKDICDFATRSISPEMADECGVLEAVIHYHCCYLGLPDTRRWFRVPERSRGVMAALAEYGYAVRCEDRYRWTTQIGPAMQANFLWDEEGRCLEELGAIAAAERVERMWERAPETVRKRFLSSEETVLDLGRMIALMWDEANQCWQAPSLDEYDEVPRAAQSLWLAQNLLRYIATGSALPRR